MKNIQIKEVILYSKDEIPKKQIVEFKTGALNVVHGISQTGKSALIPIIDYCLCSNTNRIPVGVIRNKCSAFALKLKVDNEDLLIYRKNNWLT